MHKKKVSWSVCNNIDRQIYKQTDKDRERRYNGGIFKSRQWWFSINAWKNETSLINL